MMRITKPDANDILITKVKLNQTQLILVRSKDKNGRPFQASGELHVQLSTFAMLILVWFTQSLNHRRSQLHAKGLWVRLRV